MGWFRFVVLYTAMIAGANPLWAQAGALDGLLQGSMRKLVPAAPAPVPQVALTDMAGAEVALSDFAGRVLLVNFWATWCAPCRVEMPSLSALQAEFGGADFQVVTIATGRNPAEGITRFMDEAGIDNLPIWLDPRQEFARPMAVLGLPISVIIDRQGREIARLRGEADWSEESARAVIAALIAGD